MELLTVTELAHLFRVSPATIKAWVKQRRIPVIRPTPKTIRFDVEAVRASLRRNIGETRESSYVD